MSLSYSQNRNPARRAKHYRKEQKQRNLRPQRTQAQLTAAAGAATMAAIAGRPGHDGKVGYPDRTTAEAVIGRMDLQTALRFHPLNAYRCRHCPDWHIGHNRRAEKSSLAPATTAPTLQPNISPA